VDTQKSLCARPSDLNFSIPFQPTTQKRKCLSARPPECAHRGCHPFIHLHQYVIFSTTSVCAVFIRRTPMWLTHFSRTKRCAQDHQCFAHSCCVFASLAHTHIHTHTHTQNSVRKTISVVPQDAVLFNQSVAYNIRYGAPGMRACTGRTAEVCLRE